MNKIRIYLAGTIYKEEPGLNWKQRFMNILNPHNQEPHKYEFFDPDPINEPEFYMVQRDKAEIEKCDVFVAYIERPSFGTAMEILYAYELKTKPVFIINPNGSLNNHDGSSTDLWVTYHSSLICHNVEDCAEHIKTIRF